MNSRKTAFAQGCGVFYGRRLGSTNNDSATAAGGLQSTGGLAGQFK